MTTNVIRSARVLGGFLGPPFVDSIDYRGQLWTSPELTASCRDYDHAAPAPGCQCGVWAAVSQGAYQRFLQVYRETNIRKIRWCNEAYRTQPPQAYSQLSEKVRQETEELRAQIESLPHGTEWAAHAVVGCTALDEVSQPLANPRSSWKEQVWQYEVFARQLVYDCSYEEATRLLLATEVPDGFRRYRRLRITHIWLSDACAEYADDLAQRYSARVIQVPDNRGDWLDGFIRSGQLPGLEAPTRATQTATMSATQMAMRAAAAAAMGRRG